MPKQPIKIPQSEWKEIPANEAKTGADKLPAPGVKLQANQWNEISGLQPPSVIRQFDGVNELGSFAINDTHAVKTKNLTTNKYPSLSVRKSGSILPFVTAATINGIGVRGSELHVLAGGSWYKYSNGSWSTLRTGLSYRITSFINFQGNLTDMNIIASNGYDAALKCDGNTVSTLANAPGLSKYIATHDNRVYIANKSTVYFSALRKPEDWSTVNDSGSIVVETADGKDITGLVAGSSRLTVFKGNSIHELFGNSPSNYQMKIVTDNLGCPTGHSAQVIDGIIYFLGTDGVYLYSGGSLPSSDFSLQVKETLLKINKAYADQSVSWQIGKKYFLAIPTGTNTMPDTVLMYDIDFKTWNIWNLPSPITCKGAVMDGFTYVGCADGTIYKLDDTSTTDNGTPISWEWVSKPFTFESMAAKSRWFRIWIVADIPAGATLNVSVSTDGRGSTWTAVTSITANTNIQAKEIYVPTTLINNSNWVQLKLDGTGQVVVYEVSRQERSFPLGLN